LKTAPRKVQTTSCSPDLKPGIACCTFRVASYFLLAGKELDLAIEVAFAGSNFR
jgi:hypothetical protein